MSGPNANAKTDEPPAVLVEYRLSQLEREMREALPSIRNDLHSITKQLAELTQSYQQQATLRDEINLCRTQHAEGDNKLWEEMSKERGKREVIGTDLVVERGRIDAMSKPLWLLFAAVIAQSAIVIYSVTQS